MSGNAPTQTDTVTVDSSGETTGTTNGTGHSNTSDGFITGVEPAKTPDQLRAEAAASQQVHSSAPPAGETNGERRFTQDDIENARRQEKDKLYSRIDEMDSTVKALREEREAERKAAEEAQAEAEAKAKAEAEAEMDVRELLQKTTDDFQAQLREVQSQAEIAQAQLEKERQLAALRQHREQLISQHQDSLVPEILDFIGGDTPEQLEASVQDALERSERIVQGMVQSQAAVQQQMRGTRTTLPTGNGPLEEATTQRQLTAEEIKAMSPSEYAAIRGPLQQASSQAFHGR